MPSFGQLGLACLLMALVGGCTVSRPNWLNPGPIFYQQQRSVLFDPYGDNDLGPEVVGGRPRDFQHPRSEAEKAKLFKETEPLRGGMIVAPAPPTPGGVAYPPGAVPLVPPNGTAPALPYATPIPRY